MVLPTVRESGWTVPITLAEEDESAENAEGVSESRKETMVHEQNVRVDRQGSATGEFETFSEIGSIDDAPPAHPVATMQGAFEESMAETLHGDSYDDSNDARYANANAATRRKYLLEQETYERTVAGRWRQKPGENFHPLWKLVAQISFGMHLLQEGLAKSDEEVLKILQTHVDEVDGFLERTTDDFELAQGDINERIRYLKLPLDHGHVFDQMLDDRAFRSAIVDGNEKIEHIIDRTSASMNDALKDVQKGLDATRELAKYMARVDTMWEDRSVEHDSIYLAMIGNTEGWTRAFLSVQSKGNRLRKALNQLADLVAEVQRRAGVASRKNLSPTPTMDGQYSTTSLTPPSERTAHPRSPDKPLPSAPGKGSMGNRAISASRNMSSIRSQNNSPVNGQSDDLQRRATPRSMPDAPRSASSHSLRPGTARDTENKIRRTPTPESKPNDSRSASTRSITPEIGPNNHRPMKVPKQATFSKGPTPSSMVKSTNSQPNDLIYSAASSPPPTSSLPKPPGTRPSERPNAATSDTLNAETDASKSPQPPNLLYNKDPGSLSSVPSIPPLQHYPHEIPALGRPPILRNISDSRTLMGTKPSLAGSTPITTLSPKTFHATTPAVQTGGTPSPSSSGQENEEKEDEARQDLWRIGKPSSFKTSQPSPSLPPIVPSTSPLLNSFHSQELLAQNSLSADPSIPPVKAGGSAVAPPVSVVRVAPSNEGLAVDELVLYDSDDMLDSIPLECQQSRLANRSKSATTRTENPIGPAAPLRHSRSHGNIAPTPQVLESNDVARENKETRSRKRSSPLLWQPEMTAALREDLRSTGIVDAPSTADLTKLVDKGITENRSSGQTNVQEVGTSNGPVKSEQDIHPAHRKASLPFQPAPVAPLAGKTESVASNPATSRLTGNETSTRSTADIKGLRVPRVKKIDQSAANLLPPFYLNPAAPDLLADFLAATPEISPQLTAVDSPPNATKYDVSPQYFTSPKPSTNSSQAPRPRTANSVLQTASMDRGPSGEYPSRAAAKASNQSSISAKLASSTDSNTNSNMKKGWKKMFSVHAKSTKH